MVNGFINKVVMMRQPTNNRNSIASTLNTSPLWVKTPLVLPKLWQSYSVASYILSSLREERLGEKGGFPGAVGSDDGDHASGGEARVEIDERGLVAIGDAEPPRRQRRGLGRAEEDLMSRRCVHG